MPYVLMKDPGPDLPPAVPEDTEKATVRFGDLGVAKHLLVDARYHLDLIKEDATHLKARQDRHTETIRSSRKRAYVWGGVELAVFVVSAGAQMLLMHLAFRNKK